MSSSFNSTDIKINDIDIFLNKHRLKKIDGKYDKVITHTTYGTGFNSSYHIPLEHLDEFYQLYKVAFKGNKPLNIIERHSEYSPIIIDFDFKFTDEYDSRLYNDNIIKDIVNAYMTEIKTIWKIEDESDLNAYIFKRDNAYFSKETEDGIEKIILKDGVHIMFPHIVSKPDAQHLLRKRVIPWMQDILKSLPYTNSIDNVVDKSIIESNGWYMYGSAKPNLQAYTLTDIYDTNLENIPLSIIDTYDLPKFLSILGKNEENATPIFKNVFEDLKEFQKEFQKKLKKIKVTKNNKKYNNVNIDSTDETYKNNVIQLLNVLDLKRYHDYDTWINIMWFMCKCGFSEDIIHSISKLGDNYSEDGTNDIINKYNNDKCDISVGTIFHYLKEDVKNQKVDISIYNKMVKLFNATNIEVIPLEDIKADENIKLNNIGSYMPRLDNADVVCVRSNMMTYKTQNLKELTKHYKKILIVSFRVSLDEAYMIDFKDYDFKLYSECKSSTIRDDRVIIQVDSLHKIRGAYDLLILDEFVYTSDHLVSFVKEKYIVWETIKEYIQHTPKIIVCDALLNNTCINLFRDMGRSVYVVDNTWKSFDGYTADIIINKKDLFILDIYNLLKDNKNIVVPISSLSVAETLIGYVTKHLPNIKIGYISQNTEMIQPNLWGNYNLLIYTPTIAAGISYNVEYFDNRICYFSNMSCSAELATQMLFRVRNSSCKNIKIYINNKGKDDLPTDNDELDKYIKDMDELDTKCGLNISRIQNEIIKDDYYNLYRNHLKRKNLSRNNYAGVLAGILEAHGLKVNFINPEIPELINDLKTECKEIYENITEKKAFDVCDAPIISEQEYELLNDSYKKSPEDKLKLRKYNLLKTYGERELTTEFVRKFEKLIPQYNNLCEIAKPNFIENIKNKIINKEVSKDNVNRLHQSHRNLKLYWADSIIKIMGFDNVFDNKHIQGFPYEKMKEHLIQYGDNLALLFNTSKKDWNTINIDANGKKIISGYINDRLRDIANISVVNKHRGKSRTRQEYIINGINEWTENNITFNKSNNEIKINKCKKDINNDLECFFKEIDLF